MLTFDATMARLLDDAYQGADIVERRLANFRMLDPTVGEHVVDLGCGTGLLTLELARAVGGSGSVVGIDPSVDMRARAAERCAGRAGVRILDGTANALPLPDACMDAVISVQVFEYLADVPGALAEVRRVLKPGGRVVIGDIHFDSIVWRSDDRIRMQRMLDAWDTHLADRALPERLPEYMRAAGFVVERHKPLVMFSPKLRRDSFPGVMIRLMADHAVASGQLGPDEARAFVEEQDRLAAKDRFFFAMTHFILKARLPDA